MAIRAVPSAWLAAAASLLGGSCGYHLGFVRPQGIQTVAVQVFENQTFRRGVELALTEQLSEEIATRSGLFLESADRADAVLKGKILDIVDSILLVGPNGEVRESAVWLDVEAELVDRRNGRSIAKIRLKDRAEFLTDNNQNRQTATEKASGRIAEKIVYGLFWERELRSD